MNGKRDFFTMEDNKEFNNNLKNNDGDKGANNSNENNADNNDTVLSMSKVDFDKAIQSAEDKVRGKLSKRIKELEAKVAELSPIEKTEAEIALEKRIAKLEESEKAVQMKEQRLQFRQNLTDKGIDKSLFDFIKEDSDIEAFATALSSLMNAKTKNNGYIPNEHSSDDDTSFDEYMKMTYVEKEKFMREHPEAFKRFQNQKKRR